MSVSQSGPVGLARAVAVAIVPCASNPSILMEAQNFELLILSTQTEALGAMEKVNAYSSTASRKNPKLGKSKNKISRKGKTCSAQFESCKVMITRDWSEGGGSTKS